MVEYNIQWQMFRSNFSYDITFITSDTCKQRFVFRKKLSLTQSKLKSLVYGYNQFATNKVVLGRGSFPWNSYLNLNNALGGRFLSSTLHFFLQNFQWFLWYWRLLTSNFLITKYLEILKCYVKHVNLSSISKEVHNVSLYC